MTNQFIIDAELNVDAFSLSSRQVNGPYLFTAFDVESRHRLCSDWRKYFSPAYGNAVRTEARRILAMLPKDLPILQTYGKNVAAEILKVNNAVDDQRVRRGRTEIANAWNLERPTNSQFVDIL